VKLPDRINAQPYIEQPTTVKHPKRKEDIDDLIAATEHIHIDIAELAHKYIDEEEQEKEEEQREDSLLIDSNEQKEEPKKGGSPTFQHVDEDNDLRWQTAKNKVTSYLRKITQEEPKAANIPPKT
jgi:hypothetical protein